MAAATSKTSTSPMSWNYESIFGRGTNQQKTENFCRNFFTEGSTYYLLPSHYSRNMLVSPKEAPLAVRLKNVDISHGGPVIRVIVLNSDGFETVEACLPFYERVLDYIYPLAKDPEGTIHKKATWEVLDIDPRRGPNPLARHPIQFPLAEKDSLQMHFNLAFFTLQTVMAELFAKIGEEGMHLMDSYFGGVMETFGEPCIEQPKLSRLDTCLTERCYVQPLETVTQAEVVLFRIQVNEIIFRLQDLARTLFVKKDRELPAHIQEHIALLQEREKALEALFARQCQIQILPFEDSGKIDAYLQSSLLELKLIFLALFEPYRTLNWKTKDFFSAILWPLSKKLERTCIKEIFIFQTARFLLDITRCTPLSQHAHIIEELTTDEKKLLIKLMRNGFLDKLESCATVESLRQRLEKSLRSPDEFYDKPTIGIADVGCLLC